MSSHLPQRVVLHLIPQASALLLPDEVENVATILVCLRKHKKKGKDEASNIQCRVSNSAAQSELSLPTSLRAGMIPSFNTLAPSQM